MDIEKKIKDLEKRIEQLEMLLQKKQSVPVKNSDVKKESSYSPVKKPALPAKILSKIEGFINETLQAVSKENPDLVFDLDEEFLVKNAICMGDDVIVETNKDGSIKVVKVAQRAKRSYIEALVTKKGDNFYAVTQFSTHLLLDYDVKTKGILKGFEVIVILPLGKESICKTCVTKEVESTTKHMIPTQADNVSKDVPENTTVLQYDPRIIEEDDLV